MAKEKQVVKMAKVIEITEQIARDAHCGYPSPRMMASDLYDKGYRERSEVAREIFAEVEKIIQDRRNEELKRQGDNKMVSPFTYSYDALNVIRYQISELKKKYTEDEK